MEHKTYGEQAQKQAGESLEQTRAHATETVRTAVRSGSSYFDNQKRLAAAEVDGYACALHETARRLHDQSQDLAADYAERAAHGLDAFASHLRERDIRYTVDRVGDFARRSPMLFLGGAVAAGFALTRFLKSSTEHEESHVTESVKEKLTSSVEKAKETTREAVKKSEEMAGDGKEHQAGRRDEKHPKKHARPHTAAEAEIPVILKPHDPGHPEGPTPKA